MRLALSEAWKYQGVTYPNPSVGCVVVGKNGELLSCEAHKKAGMPHAEVEALKSAYFKLSGDKEILKLENSSDIHTHLLKNHNNYFNGASIYTTLEPCSHIGKTPSCATLISQLGIKKLFVGSLDFHKAASGGIKIVQDAAVEVEYGVLQKECDELLEPFYHFLNDRFIFFKWAQRLNGTYDDGVISSLKSRTLIHKMRGVCDLLIIGGNSVRVDRPTLDARLASAKAPDVLIISRDKEFDKTIPLFSVPNRKVMIGNNFDIIKDYKNIMIEGGAGMFELTKDIVDFYLCFVSAKFGGRDNFSNIDEKFNILNIQQDEQDIIMWMKKEQ